MPISSPARRGAGFTLIELLTVIAIIAILTAIILPVFATVEENARQQSSMSNLHQIQTGLAQFKLDQGVYPYVLFGYAVPGASMDDALTVAEQYTNAAAEYFPGLYPEYVKDPAVFKDPDNFVNNASATTGPLAVNTMGAPTNSYTYPLTTTTTSPSGVTTNFYEQDAYDVGPEIGGTNAFTPSNGSPTYVPRYQLNWTGIGAADATSYSSAPGASPAWDDYTRQLRWQNPPADTYVTCTTAHVPNDDKVIVLWLNGNAQAIPHNRFLGGGAGGGSDSAGVAGANFWRVSPTNASNP